MDLEATLDVSLHNVAETTTAEWTDEGERLSRVPSAVAEELNEGAAERVRDPTGCEVRFVPATDDEPVEVTVSAASETRVRVLWGEYHPWEPTVIGTEPTTLSLRVPDRLRESSAPAGRFDHRVCRLVFERAPGIALHDVAGDRRPPVPEELPERRYLAYGTSITEGAAASAPHLNYVTHAARTRGYDALNLGCSGSAYCDPAMADHIADRDDWEVATLAMSVNMANAGFSPETFRERAARFVDAVAGENPERPVACVTLFPYFADLIPSGDHERAAVFRNALRDIVERSPHDNLFVIDGRELLDASELTADLLHPSDNGMRTIGDRLSRRLAELDA